MLEISAGELESLLRKLGVEAGNDDGLGADATGLRYHQLACFKFLRSVLNDFHSRDMAWIERQAARAKRFAFTDEGAEPEAIAIGRLVEAGARKDDILLLVRAVQSDCLRSAAYRLSDSSGRGLSPDIEDALASVNYGFWSAEADAAGDLVPRRLAGALHTMVSSLDGILPRP